MTIIDTPVQRFADAPESAPTRRACEAACLLGLDLEAHRKAGSAETISIPVAPGSIACLTGPSGAGKSALLATLRRRLTDQGWRVIDPAALRLREAPAIDLLEASAPGAMRALTSVGLGEARCFIRRPSELSEGQRFRLRLAVALDRARRSGAKRPVAVLIDEFTATLDPITARSVCLLLRRLIRRERATRLIAATTREGVPDWLGSDVIVRLNPRGGATITTEPRTSEGRCDLPLRIEPGALADYDALGHTHYRAGRPARPVHILKAVAPDLTTPAGVLVVAMPTLNAPWRSLAWPGRFDSESPADNAARLNDEVRTIARVVVDPRVRGLGVATRVVRAYLVNPLTPLTEAAAALGAAAPFFQRAGMRAYPVPPAARHGRLLDALHHAGVEPWRLATPRAALARAVSKRGRAFIECETRRWATASRATRRHTDAPLEDLFRIACRAIASAPIGYAATSNREMH